MTDDSQIAVVCEEPRWAAHLDAPEAPCVAAARAALEGAPGTLTVLLADDARLRALNQEFRGVDAPTNVLAFPMGAPDDALGDLAVAFETVAREAEEQGKPFVHHLQHLVVHGVLHLLGNDHQDDAEAERMEAAERRILAGLGVPDPYREPAAAADA